MSDNKTPEVKQEIVELSEKLAKGITINGKEGTATADKDLYEKNLPEGLAMDTVRSVRDYNTTFVAAGAHAFGTSAVEAMNKNKNLDNLNVEISMGDKDNVSYSIQRSKTTIDHLHKKGEEITKYGVLTTSMEVNAGKNSGQLKVARNQVGAMAIKMLSK